MLDLAIYMEEVETKVKTNIGPFRIKVEQVSYGFFKKTMASKLILRVSTAINMKMKYEHVRRPRTTSATTPTLTMATTTSAPMPTTTRQSPACTLERRHKVRGREWRSTCGFSHTRNRLV